MVFKESPPCILRSRSESHNGCIAHSGVRALVGLLMGQPRGTANLVGPCAIQLEVDPLQYQSYTVLLHVGPHYTQPFQELLQRGKVFDIFEQLLAFLRCLHVCAMLQGFVYNYFSR